jgi:hypothetical protein
MSNFDKDTSFLRRTAQEAERRAVSAVFAPDVTAGILPIFWSKSFLFEEGEEPAHINRFATNPQHPGLFEVRGGTEIESAYGLAVDVPLFTMASLIAAARVRFLDATNSKVRLHENLWIVLPDKSVEQVSTVKP